MAKKPNPGWFAMLARAQGSGDFGGPLALRPCFALGLLWRWSKVHSLIGFSVRGLVLFTAAQFHDGADADNNGGAVRVVTTRKNQQ